MTRLEFEPAFRNFVIAFAKDPSPERTSVYYDSLQYYDSIEVAEALNESIQSDEYFPKVSELVGRLKSKRKLKVLTCEYCSGSGWEIVYSEFAYASGQTRATRKGPLVTRQEYEAEPLKYHQFAARCRCRPPEVKK